MPAPAAPRSLAAAAPDGKAKLTHPGKAILAGKGLPELSWGRGSPRRCQRGHPAGRGLPDPPRGGGAPAGAAASRDWSSSPAAARCLFSHGQRASAAAARAWTLAPGLPLSAETPASRQAVSAPGGPARRVLVGSDMTRGERHSGVQHEGAELRAEAGGSKGPTRAPEAVKGQG